MSQFRKVSEENTKKGLEIEGILAGEFCESHFQVIHLLILEQKTAPDSWEVEDERQLTNYFTYHPSLTLLGFIHTHPRMTSFLSSVDLHTLRDYACDNKSMVSIVLVPERNTSTAFVLTNLGHEKLAKCKKKSFHKHNENVKNWYKEATHALPDEYLAVTLKDFRTNKS